MNCNIETTPDMDKELYTPEEAYELTMKDIKAIYDKSDQASITDKELKKLIKKNRLV